MVKTLSGYGLEYEKLISGDKARKMLKPYPLPKMGREIVQQSVPDPAYNGFRFELTIQNISGIYVLACSQVKTSDWESLFGIDPDSL